MKTATVKEQHDYKATVENTSVEDILIAPLDASWRLITNNFLQLT